MDILDLLGAKQRLDWRCCGIIIPEVSQNFGHFNIE